LWQDTVEESLWARRQTSTVVRVGMVGRVGTVGHVDTVGRVIYWV